MELWIFWDESYGRCHQNGAGCYTFVAENYSWNTCLKKCSKSVAQLESQEEEEPLGT